MIFNCLLIILFMIKKLNFFFTFTSNCKKNVFLPECLRRGHGSFATPFRSLKICMNFK